MEKKKKKRLGGFFGQTNIVSGPYDSLHKAYNNVIRLKHSLQTSES